MNNVYKDHKVNMPEALMSDHPADEEIFKTRLVPHRSLSPQGVRMLVGIFALCMGLSSLPFIIIGAWPVMGFMGLDVLLLYWAFVVNMRDGRAYEDVSLSTLELKIAKVDARGQRQEWSFTPAWVRLEKHRDHDDAIEHLRLVSHGRHVEIASCLGREARADFAQSLSDALRQARRGVIYS
jgi:uncharacterized membrane protein